MRDVNAGWALRYTHANVASFFFLFVYAHIARGLYYSSYRTPRSLAWTIGVIILILMMAILYLWPNWEYNNFYFLIVFVNYLKSFIINNFIIRIDNLFFNIFEIHTLLPCRMAGTETFNNIILKFNTDQFMLAFLNNSILPFNKARTKALLRIGPHNKEVLDILICGMLGDFWADKINAKQLDSVRFNIEQSISNSAYINYLTLYFYNLGYCARPVPTLIKKSNFVTPLQKINSLGAAKAEERYNYKLSLFTFSNLVWIYDAFYNKTYLNQFNYPAAGDALQDPLHLLWEDSSAMFSYEASAKGETAQDMDKSRNIVKVNIKKCVPIFISDYLSPVGLSHWIMQDGSYQKGQGVNIATNNFSYEECLFLANTLTNKYKLKTSVIKTGTVDQWRISIWKKSLPLLIEIVGPHIIPEMKYKINNYSPSQKG
jgi:LAGLIDADG DNA endonuclease family protein/cytochrome b/b6/petB-like protein